MNAIDCIRNVHKSLGLGEDVPEIDDKTIKLHYDEEYTLLDVNGLRYELLPDAPRKIFKLDSKINDRKFRGGTKNYFFCVEDELFSLAMYSFMFNDVYICTKGETGNILDKYLNSSYVLEFVKDTNVLDRIKSSFISVEESELSKDEIEEIISESNPDFPYIYVELSLLVLHKKDNVICQFYKDGKLFTMTYDLDKLFKDEQVLIRFIRGYRHFLGSDENGDFRGILYNISTLLYYLYVNGKLTK